MKGVVIACVYAPNGNPQPGPKFDYKLAWLARLRRHAATLLQDPARRSSSPATSTSRRRRSTSIRRARGTRTRWCSRKAAAPMRSCCSRAGPTLFASCIRDERAYTFWDYKRNRWPRDAGLRLDHMLLSAEPRAEAEEGGDRQGGARRGGRKRSRADVGGILAGNSGGSAAAPGGRPVSLPRLRPAPPGDRPRGRRIGARPVGFAIEIGGADEIAQAMQLCGCRASRYIPARDHPCQGRVTSSRRTSENSMRIVSIASRTSMKPAARQAAASSPGRRHRAGKVACSPFVRRPDRVSPPHRRKSGLRQSRRLRPRRPRRRLRPGARPGVTRRRPCSVRGTKCRTSSDRTRSNEAASKGSAQMSPTLNSTRGFEHCRLACSNRRQKSRGFDLRDVVVRCAGQRSRLRSRNRHRGSFRRRSSRRSRGRVLQDAGSIGPSAAHSRRRSKRRKSMKLPSVGPLALRPAAYQIAHSAKFPAGGLGRVEPIGHVPRLHRVLPLRGRVRRRRTCTDWGPHMFQNNAACAVVRSGRWLSSRWRVVLAGISTDASAQSAF